jgi:branched-chain amino acid transport system permease protein
MQTRNAWAERNSLTERLLDIAIAVFLWAFRIGVLLVVVIGSLLTLARGRYPIEVWIDLIVGGLSLGAIYALIALGYTMVYGILRMINFAHGEIFMVGAFAGFFAGMFVSGIGLLTASPIVAIVAIAFMILVAMAVAAATSLIVERVAYRPLRNAPRLVLLISAIGASFFLQYTVRGLFGPGIYAYPTVPFLAEPVELPILSMFRLKWLDVLVIGSAIGMMAVLYLFVMRTKSGTAIRAVSEDKATAALMGIDVNRAIVSTFVIGAAMAGAAGVLYGLMFRQIMFFSGFVPGIKAFTAAVLGGIGSIPGAMVGGFLLGELESVGPTLFLDGLGVPAPNQLKDVIAFTILVLVLIFRPQGIMGEPLARSRA